MPGRLPLPRAIGWFARMRRRRRDTKPGCRGATPASLPHLLGHPHCTRARCSSLPCLGAPSQATTTCYWPTATIPKAADKVNNAGPGFRAGHGWHRVVLDRPPRQLCRLLRKPITTLGALDCPLERTRAESHGSCGGGDCLMLQSVSTTNPSARASNGQTPCRGPMLPYSVSYLACSTWQVPISKYSIRILLVQYTSNAAIERYEYVKQYCLYGSARCA